MSHFTGNTNREKELLQKICALEARIEKYQNEDVHESMSCYLSHKETDALKARCAELEEQIKEAKELYFEAEEHLNGVIEELEKERDEAIKTAKSELLKSGWLADPESQNYFSTEVVKDLKDACKERDEALRKVEELTKELAYRVELNDEKREIINLYAKDRDLWKARAEKYREALEFYADRENWDDDHMSPTIWDDGAIDLGKRAKSALAEGK